MSNTSDQGNDKPTLTLGPAKLSLTKTVEVGQIRQSLPHGRSKSSRAVTVEVKKTRTFSQGAGGKMVEVKPSSTFLQEQPKHKPTHQEELAAVFGRTLTEGEKSARLRAFHHAQEVQSVEIERQEEVKKKEEAEAAIAAAEALLTPPPAPEPVIEEVQEEVKEEVVVAEEKAVPPAEPEVIAEPEAIVEPVQAELPAATPPAPPPPPVQTLSLSLASLTSHIIVAPRKVVVREPVIAPPVAVAPVAEEAAKPKKPQQTQQHAAKPASKAPVSNNRAPANVEEEKGKKTGKVETRHGAGKGRFDDAKRPNIKLLAANAEEDSEGRMRSLASLKRAREKAKRLENGPRVIEKFSREVTLPETITVQELAARMAERATDVVRELMKMGMIVTANQTIDADTAELITQTFGHKVKRVTEADVENVLLSEQVEPEAELVKRAPVVTIMGHVDHGKTSLLDALHSTDVAAGEAGGITQHIGAYRIQLENGQFITFLDTPGHEAFTAMRSRGAKVTDIVVLVVAADDGIMAQTVEAINHAKAAEVPIIVAINKIDKPGANPERVRQELLSNGLVPEELGGDIMVVEVSAKKRLNLDKLEEAILLQAEVLELKANPNRSATGVVVEAKIDKGRGVSVTILIQKGTLSVGDIIVAGTTSGKVRAIVDDKGHTIDKAYPSMPVEILGLTEVPEAGDQFAVVENDRQAREIAEFRMKRLRNLRTAATHRGTLEELFSKAAGSAKTKQLPLIVKADVHGSLEAITGSLAKLPSDEVKIRILHSAAGSITESDVSLAQASGAIILGFNVRANPQARELASREGTDLRYYSVIYNLVDDVKSALSGMLSPILREEYLGSAEIRQIFMMSKYGKVAGSMVLNGIVKRGAKVRLLRDNIVIHEGKLKTLKRFKDDVKEVREGYECGIAFENYEDIREKDIVEAFDIIEERQVL